MGSRGPVPDRRSERSIEGRNSLAPRGRGRKPSRPRPDLTPPPKPDNLPPPEWILGIPAALAFWRANAQQLVDAGRLGHPQATAFALLCQLHADCLELADQVRAEGWITATDRGQAASPAARLLRDSRRDFVTLAREFGMTAASDARLPLEEDDGEADTNSIAAFNNRAG